MFNRILLILFILFIIFMLGWCTRQPPQTTDASSATGTTGITASAGDALDTAAGTITTGAVAMAEKVARAADEVTENVRPASAGTPKERSEKSVENRAPTDTATPEPVEEPAPRPEDFMVDGKQDSEVGEPEEKPAPPAVEEKTGSALPGSGGRDEAASIVLEGVNFQSDSDRLTPGSVAVLDGVIADLKRHETIVVEIAGYTDDTGDAAYNVALSERRARAVVDYLVKGGIDAARLTAKGYGAASPIADNTTAEGRRKNRRVEMHIVQ